MSFLGGIVDGAKDVVGKAAPIAGSVIGGIYGGPAGAAVGGAAGKLVAGVVDGKSANANTAQNSQQKLALPNLLSGAASNSNTQGFLPLSEGSDISSLIGAGANDLVGSILT